MEDANLVMRLRPKQELISQISHSQSFLGFYKDIEVNIKGLKIKHSIFVVKTRDHNLILG